MEVYEPGEDSWLLKSVLKDFAKGVCLDMGTGSGILAEEAAKYCKKVIAVDVNKKAVEYCKKNCPDKRIEFRESDLFQNVPESFDTILFNFPYLPDECGDVAVDGGKDGIEIMESFLKEAKNHLNPKGSILIVFSDKTNIKKLDKIIINNKFTFKKIAEKNIFFEKLIVYKVER
jgi:release factor glutamine methyltransferase